MVVNSFSFCLDKPLFLCHIERITLLEILFFLVIFLFGYFKYLIPFSLNCSISAKKGEKKNSDNPVGFLSQVTIYFSLASS